MASSKTPQTNSESSHRAKTDMKNFKEFIEIPRPGNRRLARKHRTPRSDAPRRSLNSPATRTPGGCCGRRRRRPPEARSLVDGTVPPGRYGFLIPTRPCGACRRRSTREGIRIHLKSRHITTVRPIPSITRNRTTFTIANAPSDIESHTHTTQDRMLRRVPDACVPVAALRQRSRHESI